MSFFYTSGGLGMLCDQCGAELVPYPPTRDAGEVYAAAKGQGWLTAARPGRKQDVCPSCAGKDKQK